MKQKPCLKFVPCHFLFISICLTFFYLVFFLNLNYINGTLLHICIILHFLKKIKKNQTSAPRTDELVR